MAATEIKLTVEELEILQKGLVDTAVFSQAMFPQIFFKKFNSFHKQIIDVFDAVDEHGLPKYRKIVIAAPRGLGKTNLGVTGLVAKCILYALAEYFIYISASSDISIERTENLKRELLRSKAVRKWFGSIKADSMDEMEDTFAKESYIAKLPFHDDEDYIGTKVFPRGVGQQIRSTGFGKARPDLIIGDDIDDASKHTTELAREQIRKWWFGTVMGSVSRYDKNWRIIYIGTMTSEDCLLSKLCELPGWKSVKISACDDDYQTLDPNYMDQEEMDEMVDEYRSVGALDVFHREYMNQKGDEKTKPFNAEHFKVYDEAEIRLNLMPGIENVVLVDPARTSNMASAHTAIVGVGLDRARKWIYVRDVIDDKLHPDEIYAKSIEMAKRIGARTIACEVTGLMDFISVPFAQAIEQAGGGMQFHDLHATSGQAGGAKGERKIRRISTALGSYYRRGQIFHARHCNQALEAQLLAFPFCQRFDIIDALSYVVQFIGDVDFAFQRPQGGGEDAEWNRQLRESEAPLERPEWGVQQCLHA